MLGFGVLSLVTAAIASRWIKTEERLIEREVLRDMHREMAALHRELAALRQALGLGGSAQEAAAASHRGETGADTAALVAPSGAEKT
jgi:voltage-gated potassium channel